MKRDINTVLSGTSLLVSLLSLAGVLHVEFRLHEHKHKPGKLNTVINPGNEDSKTKEFLAVVASRRRVWRSKERKPLVSTEKSEDFKYGQNQGSFYRARRSNPTIDNSFTWMSLSDIRRQVRIELKSTLKSAICRRYRRMCLRGPKGDRGPPGFSGPFVLDKNNKSKPNEEFVENSSSVLAIIQPPKTLTVNQSDMAMFTCLISGNPTPNGTWSRANASLPVGRYMVHSNGSLTIKQVISSDRGSYVCTATNAHGKSEAQTHLRVQVPPRFIQKPKSFSVKEGHDLYLTCVASGFPNPTISWSKFSGNLPEQSSQAIPGHLRISGVGLNDNGTYICSAENLLGRVTVHVDVTIVPDLVFKVKPPALLRQSLGKPIVLHCQTIRPAEVIWMKNNTPVGPSAKVYPNGTLVIPQSIITDAGTFVCIAKRLHQEISSKTVVQIPRNSSELEKFPPKSCSELKEVLPDTPSGNYLIDPDGQSEKPAFSVFCNMEDKGGVGVTVISHDSEGKTPVLGSPMRPGSFRRDIHYGPSLDQLASLTTVSSDCEQYTEFECEGDVMFITAGYAWWVSRDNVRQDYWGGAKPGSKKCSCGMTNSCQGEPGGCNCNNKLLGSRSDNGLLTDKSTLPVTQLRFGDTDDYNEFGYFTLGDLKCYGQV